MASKILAIIPARGGSKRIPHKNIKLLNGKPLIYYTIKHARDSKIFDRIIVDTDDAKIAAVAKKYRAEVPFLRPTELAQDKTKIGDTVTFLLERLKREQNYKPDIICLLQITSPLREMQDILNCYKAISNKKVKSVCTVAETSPWFFHLGKDNVLELVNKASASSTNTQEVKKGYLLNGCMVYMIRTNFFLKIRKFVDFEGGNTFGIVCDKWRSVDLDYPKDWVLAEILHKNKKTLDGKLSKFEKS